MADLSRAPASDWARSFAIDGPKGPCRDHLSFEAALLIDRSTLRHRSLDRGRSGDGSRTLAAHEVFGRTRPIAVVQPPSDATIWLGKEKLPLVVLRSVISDLTRSCVRVAGVQTFPRVRTYRVTQRVQSPSRQVWGLVEIEAMVGRSLVHVQWRAKRRRSCGSFDSWPTLAVAMGLSVVLGACKPGPPSADLQKQLNAAVNAADVGAVVALLEKGASPDQAVGSEPDALSVACGRVGQVKGTDAAAPAAKAYVALQRQIRHRDRKLVSGVGRFEVSYTGRIPGNSDGVGIVESQLTFVLPDGTTHPVAMSAVETGFEGVVFKGMNVLIHFGVPHRLKGTVFNGTLEVDEMEARRPKLDDNSAALAVGINPIWFGRGERPMPLTLFLPSTDLAIKKCYG